MKTMKHSVMLFVFIIASQFGNAQNQLKIYSYPPIDEVVYDDLVNGISVPIEPSLTDDYSPANYKVEQNKNFTVRLSKDAVEWHDSFVYATYTSNGLRTERKKAGFVSFDFSGTVYIEVTFTQNADFNLPNTLLIRPQSKNIIPYYTKDKTFRFSISNPVKLALEVNGDRDSNLQIFANPIYNKAPQGSTVKIFEPGVHILSESNPANPNNKGGNKIYIQNGAVVIGDIKTHNNDEIYIEGGGILKGEIAVIQKSNVTIHGHGLIDLSNFAKQYTGEGGNFYHRNGILIVDSENVSVSGITVNDSQLTGIFISDSDAIKIDNFKLFTRVLWGDGIHMKGTSNVSINDCYLRTSDDGIAIYGSRRDQTDKPLATFENSYSNRSAKNITVTNTSLYTDAAHPVEIGWHGNYNKKNDGLEISNINFENIDILEHDVAYKRANGTFNRDFEGVLSINCSDGNKCSDIIFKDIRIEDFSNGRLFTVKVEPAGLGAATTKGKKVSNIRFENITYNGFGETPSVIAGLSKRRTIDGVHFINLRINGKFITKPSDYKNDNIEMLAINRYSYNITFK